MPLLRKAAIRKSVCILEFQKSEDLILATCQLYKNSRTKNADSSIYLYNGKYRLILPDGFAAQINMPTVCQFCSRLITKRIEKAKTKEHGKEICAKNAIEALGRPFTSR